MPTAVSRVLLARTAAEEVAPPEVPGDTSTLMLTALHCMQQLRIPLTGSCGRVPSGSLRMQGSATCHALPTAACMDRLAGQPGTHDGSGIHG